MEKMGLNEIREKYLSFFEERGHLRIPSFSLIPRNDPSVLLINAGMTPLKPYFTGQQTPPAPRVTNCQKCIRTPDIDRVGKTARHGTFFEMLGNFSFGDYFKKEAIAFAWEFCTVVLGLPEDRLYASVYLEDDEAYDIWKDDIGLTPERIVRLGKEDNFWEHGIGPCGPSSEIYFDRGESKGCGRSSCSVGCDCDRYVEFWNLVFTQYYREEDGSYTPLTQRNIDTGGGLERFAAIMQEVDSLFEVDTIRAVLDHVCAITGKTYGEDPDTDMAIRVITDHARSVTFMISDGILPSNEGRGYVLRRLLRRAARFGRTLGVDGSFLHTIVETVIRQSGDAYPELAGKQESILTIVRIEEERFAETVQAGMMLLEQLINDDTHGQIRAEDAFRLHDTFGFPLDLTREIAAEQGLTVDEEGFAREMAQQKKRARSALKNKKMNAWAGDSIPEGVEELPATLFTGYDTLAGEGNVLLLLRSEEETAGESLRAISEARAGQTIWLAADVTPFYAAAGGQTGDTGEIRSDTGVGIVDNTVLSGENAILHEVRIIEGHIDTGSCISMSVDRDRRLATARNHTATHILHKALRVVLGEHVAQAGSSVSPARLRFDFSHFQPMTPDELSRVEAQVNQIILADRPVRIDLLTLDEARRRGATALFDEKYGEQVRMVSVGDFSSELCGGTHLSASSQICLFRLVSESGVAAGTRRIEAVTGEEAVQKATDDALKLTQLAGLLKTASEHLTVRVEALLSENQTLQKQLANKEKNTLFAHIETLIGQAESVGPFIAVVADVPATDADSLRQLADRIRDRIQNGVVFLAAKQDDKVIFVAMATPDAVSAGAHAGTLARAAAVATGGGGGGRPDMAQAGGKNSAALETALTAIRETIRQQLS